MRSILFVAALLLIAVSADPLPSFGCQDVWKNASSKHDVMKCLQEDAGKGYIRLLVPAAVCLLCLILLVLIYPCMFCFRQCCNLCGGKQRQPGYCCTSAPEEWTGKSEEEKNAAYGMPAHLCAKLGLFITVLIAAACIIIVTTGAGKLVGSMFDTLDAVDFGVIGSIEGLGNKIKRELRETDITKFPTGYAGNISSTTFTPLDDAIKSIRKQIDDARSSLKQYTKDINIAASVISIAPLVFLVPMVIFAFFNIRKGGPVCCTCCYFLIAILFCLVGAILLILATLFTNVCGEVDRFKAGQPGILKLYAEPLCVTELTKANITSMTSTFTSKMADFSGEFCQLLTNVCDGSPDYNRFKPSSIFECSITPENAKQVCTSSAQAQVVIAEMLPKIDVTACDGEACNADKCSRSCDSETVRDLLGGAISFLNLSTKFDRAFTEAEPVLTCPFWLNTGLRAFDHCHAFESALWQLGIGFMIMIACLISGLCIGFRGQKVFTPLPLLQAVVTGAAEPTKDGDEEMKTV